MRYGFLISLFLISLNLSAQISAPGSVAARIISYPSLPGEKDPVFIYCNSDGVTRGTLFAESPGGTGPFDFSWDRWNVSTDNFDIHIKTESGVMNSTADTLPEGGYKVTISGGYDTTLIAWIAMDEKPLAEAKLQNPLKNCDYVALDGTAEATVTDFTYYDISSGAQLSLPNELTFMWSSTPESVIPYPDIDIDPISYSPPLDDVTYTLKVNTLGCSSEASFYYESIHVKADFSVDPSSGEAPLTVTFTDESVRGYYYEWDFGDDTTPSTLKDPLPHTYYRPGEYSVRLTIESDRGCIDSIRFDKITVEHSDLKIPNVFTPDGDAYNRTFMVYSKSLRYLSVEVYSQSGLKVYGFSGEGESLRNWTGWDGTINNSSRKASPGVYFYIIRALGWDDVKYDGKEYRGFVYLYR